MQIELVVKATNSSTSNTIVTLLLDCAQQTITDLSSIMNDNITYMDARKGDKAAGVSQSTQDALVGNIGSILRKQSTALALITGITAAGYYCFIRKSDGTLLNTTLTLATPASLTPTVISATEIDLAWPAITNATNSVVTYVVDRATNAGFTTGVALAIYSSTGLAYNNTGLTTGTHYYYRVRATAAGYTNSGYASGDATTS